MTRAVVDKAHPMSTTIDAHVDDPEFGYQRLADEVLAAGHEVPSGHEEYLF